MDILTSLDGFLSTGADAATIALLFVMWRFDRRLLRLEMINIMKHHKGDTSS